MDVLEIVGLLILLLAMSAPFLKRLFEKRDEKKHPEEYERKRKLQEEQQKRVLRELFGEPPEEIEMEELPPELEPEPEPEPEPKFRPVIGRKPISSVAGREFKTAFDEYDPHSKIEDRHIDTHVVSDRLQRPKDSAYAFQEERMSKMQMLMSKKGVAREMVILHEVISPPLAMRDPIQ